MAGKSSARCSPVSGLNTTSENTRERDHFFVSLNSSRLNHLKVGYIIEKYTQPILETGKSQIMAYSFYKSNGTELYTFSGIKFAEVVLRTKAVRSGGRSSLNER